MVRKIKMITDVKDNHFNKTIKQTTTYYGTRAK